jgi:hypothetical protein
MHPNYQRLVELAGRCHQSGRATHGITAQDIALARLYSYAFRGHVIGAFAATRVALEARAPTNERAALHRRRALELLESLADRAMDPIMADARALLSTFHGYDRDVCRAIDAMRDETEAGDSGVGAIADRFVKTMERITDCNGIYLTRDTEAPDQASFIVPNLGITIVPLVYGDYHSWNLAWLSGKSSDVPRHLHRAGVEIHLGYSPIHGHTILGDCMAEVHEGYAMPIAPMTAHGYLNASEQPHHVPFIFGSLKGGGWGVFFDVEPRPFQREQLRPVQLSGPEMNGSVHIERAIAEAEAARCAFRRTLIPATATDRDGSGGLELSITRVPADELSIPPASYRIISVVRGVGAVRIAGVEQRIQAHDHFGIPAGMAACVRATDSNPLVLLDAELRQTPQ